MSCRYLEHALPKSFMDMVREAVKDKPVLRGSHRGHMANLIGYTGLYAFAKWVTSNAKNWSSRGISNVKAEIIDVVNYDVGVSFTYGGKDYSFRIEVKTKDRTVKPRPDFEISVPTNTFERQKPDYYFAISLLRDRGSPDQFTRIYFIGSLSRTKYERVKYLEAKGEKANGADFFHDTWNARFTEMDEPIDFPLNMLKSEERLECS